MFEHLYPDGSGTALARFDQELIKRGYDNVARERFVLEMSECFEKLEKTGGVTDFHGSVDFALALIDSSRRVREKVLR